MKIKYVYTELAQEQAAARGLEPRLAGSPALFGYDPVDGITARAWMEIGHIAPMDESAPAPEQLCFAVEIPAYNFCTNDLVISFAQKCGLDWYYRNMQLVLSFHGSEYKYPELSHLPGESFYSVHMTKT